MIINYVTPIADIVINLSLKAFIRLIWIMQNISSTTLMLHGNFVYSVLSADMIIAKMLKA